MFCHAWVCSTKKSEVSWCRVSEILKCGDRWSYFVLLQYDLIFPDNCNIFGIFFFLFFFLPEKTIKDSLLSLPYLYNLPLRQIDYTLI